MDNWGDEETGDEELFFKQLEIGLDLGLPLLGPVYKPWQPNPETLGLLKPAVDFVRKYGTVTVRQIYYGLVSRQVIANTLREYKRLDRVVTRARLAGLIPFDAVVDDTRKAEKTPSWGDIQEIMDVAIRQYRSDWWADQPNYVEVWLEKRALRRIFYPITNSYDVHLCVGGGYQSWSELWEAKRRFESRDDQDVIILYFGDLDPSGKDMPRDIEERLETLNMFVTVKEIALTREDIEEYDLPRNPMKPEDTRNEWYLRKYGINYAVELDALSPEILREKIKQAILEHVDLDKLLEKKERDEHDRHKMDNWVRLFQNHEEDLSSSRAHEFEQALRRVKRDYELRGKCSGLPSSFYELPNILGWELFDKAWQALKSRNVARCEFESGTSIWVMEDKDREHVIMPEANFCSCYYYQVISEKREAPPVCSHLVTCKLAEAIDFFVPVKVVDPLRGPTSKWQEREKRLEEDRKWIDYQYRRLMKLGDDELKEIATSPPTGEQHLGFTIQKMAEDVLFTRAMTNSNPEDPKHRRGNGGAN